MLSLVPQGSGGFRLLVGAIPLTVLVVLAGLVVLLSLFLKREHRLFVLRLAPHLEATVRAIAGVNGT